MVDQPESPAPRMKLRKTGKLMLPPTAPGMNKLRPINRPPDDKGAKEDGPPKVKSDVPDAEKDSEILERIIKRVNLCIAAESDNRKAALDDRKFKSGNQWPADVATQRATDKRPMLTVNELPNFVNQVTNSQRENRPSINVSPVGEKGDKDAAKMYRGLIRHIERASRAEIAYDTAFDDAVTSGFGYIRLTTEWEAEDSFDQVICIKRVRNPFTVYLDPSHQEPDGADNRYGIVTEIIPEDEFKEEYPDAQPVPFNLGGTGEKYRDWKKDDGVRVAEYYEVKTEDRDLVRLTNGAVMWKDEVPSHMEQHVEETRTAQCRSVKYYKVNAIEILETRDWLGKWVPIIPVIGNEMDIEGKVMLSGVIRQAKDAQRMLNYWTTMEAEVVALAPKAPYILEEGQLEGHERQWKNANVKNYPYLLYKGTSVSGRAAPPPQRQPPGQVPEGIITAKQGALTALMATTGIRYDPNTNPADLRESGRLIQEQRRNSDIGAFHYIDNLGRSLKFLGDQLIDLIPKVYDRKRVLTILREDDTEEQVTVDPNQPQPYQEVRGPKGMVKMFNPTVGKYGVTVDIGPSYATKRIEAAESMMEFVKAMPHTAQLVMDLVAAEMDWPGADKIAARLAKAIPPQLLAPDMKDLTPQVQALIQNLDMQSKQLGQQLQIAMKQLDDKQKDRDVALEKISKDFEAKLLGVIQKAEASTAKTLAEQDRTELEFVKHQGSMENSAADREVKADGRGNS